MKAVTKFYSNGREVDIVESVKATILESVAPFTAQDVYECLSAANPTDEYLSEDSVRRACRMFCNPMSPSKSFFIMDEIESGVYLRHGVEVKPVVEEIPAQIVVASEMPSPESKRVSEEVRNDEMSYVKPYGGFWTSSETGQGQSAWTAWCEREMPAWLEGSRYRLTPAKDARVFVVSSLDDLARLQALYPRKFWLGGYACLDFEAMSQQWDGLRVTAEGEQAIRAAGRNALHYPADQQEWSCESTVWFRWCFEKVEEISE